MGPKVKSLPLSFNGAGDGQRRRASENRYVEGHAGPVQMQEWEASPGGVEREGRLLVWAIQDQGRADGDGMQMEMGWTDVTRKTLHTQVTATRVKRYVSVSLTVMYGARHHRRSKCWR